MDAVRDSHPAKGQPNLRTFRLLSTARSQPVRSRYYVNSVVSVHLVFCDLNRIWAVRELRARVMVVQIGVMVATQPFIPPT